MDMVRRLLWVTLTLPVGSDSPTSYKWPALLYKNYSELIMHLRKEIPEPKLVELALRQCYNPKVMTVPVARVLGRSSIDVREMDEQCKPDFSVFSAQLKCAVDPKVEELRLKDEALYLDFHRAIDDVVEILSRAGLSGERKPSAFWTERAQSSLHAMKDPSPGALAKVHDRDTGKDESDGQVVAATQPEGIGADVEDEAGVHDSNRSKAERGDTGDYGAIQENNTARDSDPSRDSSTPAEGSQSQISVPNAKGDTGRTASDKVMISQVPNGLSSVKLDSGHIGTGKDVPLTGPQGGKDSYLYDGAIGSQAESFTRKVLMTSPSKSAKRRDPSFHVTPSSLVTASATSLDWQFELKIELAETWDSVKDKLQYAGFTCTECGAFIPPNGKGPGQNGVNGRDFFDQVGMKEMIRKKYGWIGSTAHNEERTPKKRKADTAMSDRIQERPKRHSRTPCQSPRKHDEFWNFKNIMPYLRRMGWKYEESKNVLKDWCYVLPGRRQETGTYGVDFFYEENEVVEFSKKQYNQKMLLKMEANVLNETTQQADSMGSSRANAVSP